MVTTAAAAAATAMALAMAMAIAMTTAMAILFKCTYESSIRKQAFDFQFGRYRYQLRVPRTAFRGIHDGHNEYP